MIDTEILFVDDKSNMQLLSREVEIRMKPKRSALLLLCSILESHFGNATEDMKVYVIGGYANYLIGEREYYDDIDMYISKKVRATKSVDNLIASPPFVYDKNCDKLFHYLYGHCSLRVSLMDTEFHIVVDDFGANSVINDWISYAMNSCSSYQSHALLLGTDVLRRNDYSKWYTGQCVCRLELGMIQSVVANNNVSYVMKIAKRFGLDVSRGVAGELTRCASVNRLLQMEREGLTASYHKARLILSNSCKCTKTSEYAI